MTKKEVLDWLYRIKSKLTMYFPIKWVSECEQAIDYAIKALESQKTGHWIDLDVHSAVCSCCYKNNTLNGDFCKWCGAKMKGGNNE